QDGHHASRRKGRLHGPALALPGHPLPLAGGRTREPAGLPGSHRLAGGRHHHGPAPPRKADRRRPVPPRIHRLGTRPPVAAQLPRHGESEGPRMSDALRNLIGTAASRPLTRAEAEAAFTALFEGEATRPRWAAS